MCCFQYITASFIVVGCCCCVEVVALHLHLRNRRDTDEVKGIGIPSDEDPQPFQALGSDSMAPWFPLTHTFADGMSINKGDNSEMSGRLNVPLMGWGGMWDVKSHFKSGPDNTWWNYGHLLSPANPLRLSPATVAGMATSPKITAERNKADSVPVINLPTGFTPVKCKPPLCNPFVHTFDTGFHIEPATYDIVPLAGSLDFPVRMPDGTYRRFPISGDLDSGQESPSVVYGQMFSGGVDPFRNDARRGKSKQNLPFGLMPEPSRNMLSDTPPASANIRTVDRQRPQVQTASAASRERSRSESPSVESQSLADIPLAFGSRTTSRDFNRRMFPATSTIMPKFIWPRGS